MIIDWLSFNCSDTKDNRVKLLNSFENIAHRGKSFLNCGTRLEVENQKKKILIDMSSKAVSTKTYEQIRDFIFLENFKIRRLDIAFDEKKNLLSINDLWNLIQQKSFTSIFKKFNIIDNVEFSGKRIYRGKTLYLGNRASHTFLRIYDKLEQSKKIKKGEKLSILKKRFKELKSIPSWTRIEFEFKQQNATRVFEKIIQEDWNPKSYLYKAIDFKSIKDTQKRVDRRQTDDDWNIFLDGIEKDKIGLPEKYWSLETLENWINNQVSPSLYGLEKKLGKEKIDQLVENGKIRYEKNLKRKFEYED